MQAPYNMDVNIMAFIICRLKFWMDLMRQEKCSPGLVNFLITSPNHIPVRKLLVPPTTELCPLTSAILSMPGSRICLYLTMVFIDKNTLNLLCCYRITYMQILDCCILSQVLAREDYWFWFWLPCIICKYKK